MSNRNKLMQIIFSEKDGRLDMTITRYEENERRYGGKLNDGDAKINGYLHGRGFVDDPLTSDIKSFLQEFTKGMQYSIDYPEPTEHDRLRAAFAIESKRRRSGRQEQQDV
jgi:hypothetical protein